MINRRFAGLVVMGCLLVVAAAPLPWLTIGAVTATGLDGLARSVPLLAIGVLLYVGWSIATRSRLRPGRIALAAVACIVLPIWIVSSYWGQFSGLSVGVGLVLTLLGGAMILGGAVALERASHADVVA